MRETLRSCNEKLARSKRLIDLLEEENKRWSQDIEQFRKSGRFIEGNAAIAAAIISYCGAFDFESRQRIEKSLARYLEELQVPIDLKQNFISFMGSEIEIQKWAIN